MVECAPSSAPSSAPQPCRPRDLDGVYCPRTVAPGPREASPSLVYGAALLMRLGVRLPPGFKSRSLRSCGHPGPESQVDHAPVAQRIEHLTTDQKVGGSNPFGRASAEAPPSVLDLANNRVLPNSPHASSGGGWAGRPCSGMGSTQGRVGFAPAPSSPHAASGATSGVSVAVVPARVGSHAARRVRTTNSWRSRAAAIAAWAWPSCRGFWVRVVRWV